MSGVDECKDILQCVLKGELHNCLLELNACVSGCVNGPVSGKKSNDRFKSQMLVQERIMPEFPEYTEIDMIYPSIFGHIQSLRRCRLREL